MLGKRSSSRNLEKFWSLRRCARQFLNSYIALITPGGELPFDSLAVRIIGRPCGWTCAAGVALARSVNRIKSADTKAPFGEFKEVDRFEHVHTDIVVMPKVNGYRYAVTFIDRRTRWVEAVPATAHRSSRYSEGICKRLGGSLQPPSNAHVGPRSAVLLKIVSRDLSLAGGTFRANHGL